MLSQLRMDCIWLQWANRGVGCCWVATGVVLWCWNTISRCHPAQLPGEGATLDFGVLVFRFACRQPSDVDQGGCMGFFLGLIFYGATQSDVGITERSFPLPTRTFPVSGFGVSTAQRNATYKINIYIYTYIYILIISYYIVIWRTSAHSSAGCCLRFGSGWPAQDPWNFQRICPAASANLKKFGPL